MIRPPINRRSDRSPITLAVQCRTQSGLRDSGEMSDVSAEGCCLRLNGVYFRVGARVMLRPEGMEALSGLVRWVRGDLAGIEFDRPIYRPVLDHLVTIHGSKIG
jgi:hypothetical protein